MDVWGALGAVPPWGEAVLLCAASVVVWTLSLYVVSRGGWQPVPALATLSMWALALYELGVGVGSIAPDDQTWKLWFRGTWPGPALLPALWLLLTAALAVEEGPAAWQPRLRGLFRVALCTALPLGLLFAAGSAFDFVRRWETEGGAVVPPVGYLGGAYPGRRSYPGPLYPLYAAYVLACAVWAAANLIGLWRASVPGTPLRVRFRWLLVAALLFGLGGSYLSWAAGQEENLSGLAGHLLLLAGMLIVGWTVARYGALLAGEVVSGDAPAYVASMGALLVLYGLVLAVLLPLNGTWPQQAIPLLLLAVTTHVVVVRRGAFLDRLLYGRAGGALRSQLGALTERVARQPDTLSALADARETVGALVRAPEGEGNRPAGPEETARASLRVLVEGALRRLNDLPALSENPLLERLPEAAAPARRSAPPPFPGPAPASRSAPAPVLERAAGLREALTQAIGRLRPQGPRPNPGPQGAQGGWLHYLVLQEAYVEGRPNKQIMQRYYLSEGTFHRARRRAIDVLAADLAERSALPGQPAPGPPSSPTPPGATGPSMAAAPPAPASP
jgi:hypothetical protein